MRKLTASWLTDGRPGACTPARLSENSLVHCSHSHTATLACTLVAPQEHGIHVTAYSPLGSPHTAGFFKRRDDVPILMEVSGSVQHGGRGA